VRLQLSPPGRPQTKECPLLGAFLYTVSPQFMPLPLAEAKISDEPKGDGSVAYSPVWDLGTSKKVMGSNPRVMAQWYSLSGTVGPQKSYGFKPKVDGSMAHSPLSGTVGSQKGLWVQIQG